MSDDRHNTTGALGLSRWLLRYALRRWPGMLVVLATMLLKIGLDVLRPWPMKVLVDYALHGKERPEWLASMLALLPGQDSARALVFWCVGGTVVIFALGWALASISAMNNVGFGQRLAFDLAADVFRHLQRLSLRFHAAKTVGDSIRRVTRDSACVSTIVKDALLPVLASVATLLVMFFILWRLNWPLALAALAVVPLMFLVLRRYAEPMQQVGYRQQEVEGQMYAVVEQNLSALPIVQAFAREEEADRQFRQATDQSLAAALATRRIQLQFNFLIRLATAAGTSAILWLGASQVLAGELTVGGILVFISYLGSIYGPLESLAYTSSTIQGAAGSAKRVLEVLQSPPDVRDAHGALPIPAVRGEVRIENVTFGYEKDRAILQDVSLSASPGETIAIVGPTGAGKSTLVGLIPRFFDPWEGRVLLDGHDLRQVRLRELREKIAIVLQEPFLFPMTIAQNIAYGRPGATMEQIEAAARDSNAQEFIEKLPERYETIVGERGATLSGGQRQRLSIARALLKDAPILILDEPTSALDAQTEGLLVEALHRLMRGRTTFIIAHRLSTIRRADRIIVLERGEIIEQGAHADLVRQQGVYARMCLVQFGPAAISE